MSTLTKIFCLNSGFKRKVFFTYLCNEVRLNRIQYYSVFNERNVRCKKFHFEVIERRRYSRMTWFQHVIIRFNQAISDLFHGRFRYVPFFSSGKFKCSGYLWYITLDDVRVTEFLTLFEMPDTFYSRCRVIELHVWMLLFCLPQKNRAQSLVRYGLIEAMWKDIENRAKLMEKHNENFKKDMSRLYEEFKVNIFLYDIGFYKNDVALSNALWYSFFERKNVDPRLLEALVYFVRHQLQIVQGLNLEKILTLDSKEKHEIWISPKPFVESILNYPTSRGKLTMTILPSD